VDVEAVLATVATLRQRLAPSVALSSAVDPLTARVDVISDGLRDPTSHVHRDDVTLRRVAAAVAELVSYSEQSGVEDHLDAIVALLGGGATTTTPHAPETATAALTAACARMTIAPTMPRMCVAAPPAACGVTSHTNSRRVTVALSVSAAFSARHTKSPHRLIRATFVFR
jgi:hypothetical protein